MYSLKVMKQDGSWEMHECDHFIVREVPAGSVAATQGLATVGLTVEISRGPTVSIPQEATVIYVLNDRGDTIDKLAWKGPRKESKEV